MHAAEADRASRNAALTLTLALPADRRRPVRLRLCGPRRPLAAAAGAPALGPGVCGNEHCQSGAANRAAWGCGAAHGPGPCHRRRRTYAGAVRSRYPGRPVGTARRVLPVGLGCPAGAPVCPAAADHPRAEPREPSPAQRAGSLQVWSFCMGFALDGLFVFGLTLIAVAGLGRSGVIAASVAMALR